MIANISTPAIALWNQRTRLANRKDQIKNLFEAVGYPTDLTLDQWTQLMAFALDFAPDTIIDLGRGKGNSTCAFTEVANMLKPKNCKVLSLCLSDDWDKETMPKIENLVPASWFNPLTIYQTDILKFDYEEALKNSQKVLLFWDAHGYEVAECVLGKILPLIADLPHVVIMHDLSDIRYMSEESNNYNDNGIWKGNNWEGPRLRIGSIESAVEQVIPIMDFSTRNKMPLHSSDESYHTEFSSEQITELTNLFGEEFISKQGHWFWFTLNEIPESISFPSFISPSTGEKRIDKAINNGEFSQKIAPEKNLRSRFKAALKMLLEGE
jgi:hypothetical protein